MRSKTARKTHSYRIKFGGWEFRIICMTFLLLSFGFVHTLTFSTYSPTDQPLSDFLEPLWAFGGILIASVIIASLLRCLNATWIVISGILLLLGSLAFLIYTSQHGVIISGARRWVEIGGHTFQPVEPFKVAVVITGAAVINRMTSKNRVLSLLFSIPFLAIILIGLYMVFSQPDRSSTFILFASIFTMPLFSNVKKICKIIVTGFFIIGIVALIFFSFQSDNIRSRFSDTADAKFQRNQAAAAIASGGWFPDAVGQSVLKYSLPAASTDFIFAIIVEQFGFIISAILLLCYMLLYIWAFTVSAKEQNHLLKIIGIGATFILMFNTLVHIIINMGIFSFTTGVNLPFISKGGSALLFNLITIGLILNIARRRDLESDIN